MRRFVPFALLPLLLACSGDDDPAAPAATTRPAAAVEVTTTTRRPTTTTSAAAATTTTEPCGVEPGAGELLAEVDLDGDGVDERWREAGSGASVQIVELRVLDGCDEEPATFPDGSPAQFPVGGTVTHLDAVRCGEDGSVVRTSVTSDDGVTYRGTATTYVLRAGGALVVDAEAPVTTTPDTDFTCAPGA